MTEARHLEWTAVILAAGEGKRMQSELPKVLHPVAGQSMIAWAIDAAKSAGSTHSVVVVGHSRQSVQAEVGRVDPRAVCVVQAEQRGTGDAVAVALNDGQIRSRHVVVLYGDCPLIDPSSVRVLVKRTVEMNADAGLITATKSDPRGYGRIERNSGGDIVAIVEDRDCSPEQARIDEVNPGIYCFRTEFLQNALRSIDTKNAQSELYLTDVIAAAHRSTGVVSIRGDIDRLGGVNDRYDLATANHRAYQLIAKEFAIKGVGMRDPNRLCIDRGVEVQPDAFLDADVHLRGETKIMTGASIGVGCILQNVIVDQNASILPYSVATDSHIGAEAVVGPFAHLRSNTTLQRSAKVGNFSETKNTVVGEGSKVNHLSYVGDGRIGRNVNIGAGTIFCNYDGVNKHITTLEDDVFIGSDSQLVAPVTVGEGSYVASGTTVTTDVPPNALAIARAKQKTCSSTHRSCARPKNK
ncbi:MAG: bifunctional UDP-N-acetylglucosamine diphosphorylase/glucosamine-1-phosphate N-acetyltransferase GlmU [Polyangiales bacterium]